MAGKCPVIPALPDYGRQGRQEGAPYKRKFLLLASRSLLRAREAPSYGRGAAQYEGGIS